MANKLEIAGIIQRMEAAGEPEANIRAVVAAWDREQAKVAAPAAPAQPLEPTGITDPLQAVGAKIAQISRMPNTDPLKQLRTANVPFDVAGGIVGAGMNLLVPKTSQEAIGRGISSVGSFARSPLLEQVGAAFARTGAGKALYNLGQNEYAKETGKLGVNLASLLPIGAAAKAAKVGETIVKPAGEAVVSVGKGLMPNEAAKSLGKGLQNAANRMENTSIKIGAAEQRMGAKPEYFGKYNLFGNPGKVQESAIEQIRETAGQLKAKIAESSADPANNVNVLDMLESAKAKALENTTFGRGKVQREFDGVLNDLVDRYGDKLESMDLADAQELKRAIGKQGDWYEAPMGGKMAEDSNVKTQVFNSLYDEFKRNIETKGGPQIKELNTKLSELIPMERAASKRLLVSSRNNPIRLDDYIGGLAVAGSAASGHILPLAVAAGNIASKSPSVAKALSATGKAIESAATKPVSLGKIGEDIKGALGNQRGSIGVLGDNTKAIIQNRPAVAETALRFAKEDGAEITPDGKIVLYHGTRSGDKINSSGVLKSGSWLSSDPNLAKKFAMQAQQRGKADIIRMEVDPQAIFPSAKGYYSINEPVYKSGNQWNVKKNNLGALGNERGAVGGGDRLSFDDLKNQSGFRRYTDDVVVAKGTPAIDIETGKQITLSEKAASIYNELKNKTADELESVPVEKLNIFNHLKENIGINPGPERVFYRTGSPAKIGQRSHNFRDQKDEKGVSVYFQPEARSFAGANSDKWYYGKGKQIGWGSDDEPVIVPTEIWKEYKKSQSGNTGLKMLAGTSAASLAGLTGAGMIQNRKGRKLSDIGRK